MLGTGNVKMLSLLDIVESKKLWVLPISIKTITLLFLICPFNFNVWGCDILIMVDNDTYEIFSLSSFGENSGESSIYSMSHSSLSESLVASHLYRFLVSFPLTHLCLGFHFSPQRLHLSSFIFCISELVFSPSRKCGGTYLVLFVSAVWENLCLEYSLSTFGHCIFSCFFSTNFAFCLATSRNDVLKLKFNLKMGFKSHGV